MDEIKWDSKVLEDIEDKKNAPLTPSEPSKPAYTPDYHKPMLRKKPIDYEALRNPKLAPKKDINEGLPEDPPERTIIMFRRKGLYYLGFKAPSDLLIRYTTHSEEKVDRNAKLFVEPFTFEKGGHRLKARAFDKDNNPVSRTYFFRTY